MNIRSLQLPAALAICTAYASLLHAQQQHLPNQGLFRHATIEKAWQKAVNDNRPLLVMFTSDNCLFCQKMLSQTYRHPAIQRLLAPQVESVLAHSDDYGLLIQRMGIRGFPTSLLISPQGQILEVFEGFVEPKQFAERVSPILANRSNRP